MLLSKILFQVHKNVIYRLQHDIYSIPFGPGKAKLKERCEDLLVFNMTNDVVYGYLQS